MGHAFFQNFQCMMMHMQNSKEQKRWHNFPQFSFGKVNNSILAIYFGVYAVGFKPFNVYSLFNHGNYGIPKYLFHLWQEHIWILFYSVYFAFLLSLCFLHSCETNICTMVILCRPLIDILPRNKKNVPGKIIEKPNKHFNINSRNSFWLHNPSYKNFHLIIKI